MLTAKAAGEAKTVRPAMVMMMHRHRLQRRQRLQCYGGEGRDGREIWAPESGTSEDCGGVQRGRERIMLFSAKLLLAQKDPVCSITYRLFWFTLLVVMHKTEKRTLVAERWQ
jgi:hypothetical protein